MPFNPHFAKQLAVASFANARIERLFLLESRSQVVRFSDRRGVRAAVGHGLTIAEDELLILIGDAIAARVFSSGFVRDLQRIVCAQER